MAAVNVPDLYLTLDNHNRIHFLRSDCDEDELDAEQLCDIHIIAWDHKRSIAWRGEIASELARILRLQKRGNEPYDLMAWPSGYKFVITGETELRSVLRGRTDFSSPWNFVLHAVWLASAPNVNAKHSEFGRASQNLVGKEHNFPLQSQFDLSPQHPYDDTSSCVDFLPKTKKKSKKNTLKRGAEQQSSPPGHLDFQRTDNPTGRLVASRSGMAKLPLNHKSNLTWRSKVGDGLKLIFDLPDSFEYQWPGGYHMYTVPKGGCSPGTRHLLLGAKCFQSPHAFIPHAYWLYTDPNLKVKNCRCPVCTKRFVSAVLQDLGLVRDGLGLRRIHGQRDLPAPLPKRSIQTSSTRPQVPRKSLSVASSSQSMRVTKKLPSVIERGWTATEYRLGELVWVQVAEPGTGCTMWPAIIESVVPSSRSASESISLIKDRQSASGLALCAASFANEPILLQVSRLSSRDRSVQTVSATETLPFSACSMECLSAQPTFLRDTYYSSIEEAVKIALSFSLVRPDNEDEDNLANPDQMFLFSGSFDRIPPDEDYLRSADVSVPQRMSRSVTRSHALSVFEDLPEHLAVQLWWGPELIQRGDMVLLALGHVDVFMDAGFASAARRARALFIQVYEVLVKDSPLDDPLPTKEIKVVGMLYELFAQSSSPQLVDADEDMMDVDANVNEPNESLGELISYPLPSPPPGYRFNKIMKFSLCPTLITGRYYPGIWTHPLATSSWLGTDDTLMHLRGLSVRESELSLDGPPTFYTSREEARSAIREETNAAAIEAVPDLDQPDEARYSVSVSDSSERTTTAVGTTQNSRSSPSESSNASDETDLTMDTSDDGDAVFERVCGLLQEIAQEIEKSFDAFLKSDFFSRLEVMPLSLLDVREFWPLHCLPPENQAQVTREVLHGFMLVTRFVGVFLLNQHVPNVEEVQASLDCISDENKESSGIEELLTAGGSVSGVVRCIAEKAKSEHPDWVGKEDWEKIWRLLGLV